MRTGEQLAAFLESPGFTDEELRTALKVISALEPMMPEAWDSEGGENLIEVLSYLLDQIPLSRDLEEFVRRTGRHAP